MKNFEKLIKGAGAAFLSTLWCTSPVWGDDTEIFFGAVDSNTARPNVLFIIDTSGSMSGTVDGTGKDRLDNVKDAMYQLLDELNNVNVGLMRFTNPGGPVLYPVSYIDKDLSAGSLVDVDVSIAASSDDAQEFVSNGLMVLDGRTLEMTENTSAGRIYFEDQVSSSDDDAEEASNGDMTRYSNDLDLEGTQIIGVRFPGSSVPATAVITNAFLRFTGDGGGDGAPLTYRILAEADDSGTFGGGDDNISNRTTTSASVDWTITDAVVGGQTIDTPNIATVVQEVISDSDWIPNGGEDDMVFILEPVSGSGRREFETRDGSASLAPRLFIEYYIPPAPVAGPTRTGLRFQAVGVPRGVTITEAYLTFTADRDFTSTYDLTVGIENVGDATTFLAAPGNIGARTLASTTVGWAGSMTVNSGDTFQSPNIASLVNAVSTRGDWCGGNDLALVISGSTGQLPAWAFDGDATRAPRLQLRYEYDSIVPGSTCIRRTLSRTITNSTDDAEETGSSANTNSGDLDFYSGSVVGLRFPQMTIPRGATIYDAYIEVVADAGDSGTTNMAIKIETSDDADTYSGTNGTIEDRSYSSSSVAWNQIAAWSTDDVIRTGDLSSLVSSVTSRSGWSSGNALAFRIDTSTSTDREAESVDGSPGEAPRLVVDFQDDGTGLATSRKVREVMKDLVSQLNHNGWTPVQDTLYEAARYYTGMSVLYGKTRGDDSIDGGPFSYARISAAESMVDGSYSIIRPSGCSVSNLDDNDCENERINGVGGEPMYESPINDFCQEQSHIIMLTDGVANRPHSTDLIPDFTGEACLNEATVNDDGSTTALTDGELCVKDLARYMNENDLRPTLDLNQRVTTHTIGFNFSSKWLEDVAAAGGGFYKTANNATELAAEIKDIIGEVLKTDSTFVAPVAAVNEFNQLSHLRQVYFAVFRPDEVPSWRGNLKRYSLSEEGADIVDYNGNLAIDGSTGFFKETARSYWSSLTDGALIDIGGAEENMPANASRNVYTYYDGSASSNLANSANALVSTNTDLTQSMFDVSMTATEFAEHIDWIRGRDVDDENENGNTSENRYIFGDPLHSRPVAVTYGGSETSPDVTIFMGTNAGSIQAFNAATGAETFAFIPEAMLPLQNVLRQNQVTNEHPYGIDGTPTVWSNDNNRDGIDTSDAEDFVRVYTGMRRGGRNYYALDVSDRSNPVLMWQIDGGTVHANGDDFRELGQSWSRPIKTKVILSGDTAPREVLLFSAGYDEAQDEAQLRTADGMGRGMYMVDAITGRLLWSGGKTGAQAWTESFSAMDYSFPSTMSVVDINQDGLADMWFGADTGGRVWRFDIANGESLANLVTGGVIADLGVAGGTNSIAENRRFYASPSVALVRGPDGPELALAIGSGFRASPLSELASNRMFMIRQQAVFSAPSSYTAITTSDLYNATSNTLATATGTTLESEQELLYESQGWYFDLGLSGEKVLSSPLIANDRVVFTTYTPGSSGVWCRPAAGTSRAYSVRLEDAVRTEPRPLLTPSIVDQATIIVPPPFVPDPNEPEDPNDPDDPNEPPNPCPNGNNVVIKLNMEDGGVDNWCNNAAKTYWIKEQ